MTVKDEILRFLDENVHYIKTHWKKSENNDGEWIPANSNLRKM